MGESLEVGLRREVREELGVELAISGYLGSFADFYGPSRIPTLNAFFVASISGGVPEPASDVAGYEWFEADEALPEIAFENGRQALRLWSQLRESGGGRSRREP
jgi:8-oxo-dGTP pyrophosphatase MutT (NUDIX family)